MTDTLRRSRTDESTGSGKPRLIERGEPAFWHTNLALFAAGFATFALLYCVQPLMPVFSAAFGTTAAASSLVLSATTLPLAFAMLVASAVSDTVGRKPLMVASMFASAALCVVSAGAPGFGALVAVRGLMGLTLSGLPAVAMAYVAEEMSAQAAGLGMGLYIGGSAVGGMSGRLASALLAEQLGWRAALLTTGGVGLMCGLLLWRFLPPSRHFQPRAYGWRGSVAAFARHRHSAVLPRLFAEGFLLMGGFVSVYNYIGYRLLGPPYRLGQGSVGLIFSVYLVGVASSAVMGSLALRLGRRRVMVANILFMAAGLAATLAHPVWAIVLGVACVTGGFFGAHSVASGWVGAAAAGGRAQASALYLFTYYAGSSVAGSLIGLIWPWQGWPGLACAVGLLLLAAIMLVPGSRPATPA